MTSEIIAAIPPSQPSGTKKGRPRKYKTEEERQIQYRQYRIRRYLRVANRANGIPDPPRTIMSEEERKLRVRQNARNYYQNHKEKCNATRTEYNHRKRAQTEST